MKQGLLSGAQRAALWTRLGIRAGITLLVLLFLRQFGNGLLKLIMPFLLGWGMAVLLDPLVCWVHNHLRAPREAASLVIVLMLLTLLGGGFLLLLYYLGRELVDLARNWSVLFDAFQGVLDSLEQMFARLFSIVPPELTAAVDIAINEVLIWLENVIPDTIKALGESARDKFMGVPSLVIAAVIFFIGTYFMTVDYPDICSRAGRTMGDGLCRMLSRFRSIVLAAFGGYLKAQLLLSAGVFCILLLGFLVIGQQYALLLALGLAVLDFIPLFGAGTAMIPWAVVELLNRDYAGTVAVSLIWGIVAVYRRAAEPKIVGNQTGLSPILSLFSIYIGMKVGGVTGMIFGPIFILVGLNLIRSGLFCHLFRDIQRAGGDLAAILSADAER